MSKLRTDCLPLNGELGRREGHTTDSARTRALLRRCPLCALDQPDCCVEETVTHRMVVCPRLEPARSLMFETLATQADSDEAWSAFVSAYSANTCPEARALFLLGPAYHEDLAWVSAEVEARVHGVRRHTIASHLYRMWLLREQILTREGPVLPPPLVPS